VTDYNDDDDGVDDDEYYRTQTLSYQNYKDITVKISTNIQIPEIINLTL